MRKAEERAHILRGLVKALDMLDEVIALIRRSPTVDESRTGLMALLSVDEIQANAILEMQFARCRRPAGRERPATRVRADRRGHPQGDPRRHTARRV